MDLFATNLNTVRENVNFQRACHEEYNTVDHVARNLNTVREDVNFQRASHEECSSADLVAIKYKP